MTQKVSVLYHANCLDGMMSAAIVYKYLTEELKLPKDDLRFLPVKYQENPPILRPDSKVYIVDFSYPREVILDLQSRHEVIIYDHHKTAQEQLLGIKGALFDMDESGATLTWKQLFPNKPVPYTVQMIRDRDLWLWELPESKSFTEAVYNLLDMTVESWQRLLTTNSTNPYDFGVVISNLISQGDAIVAASNNQVKRQLENVYWAKLPLHDDLIPMINSGHLISETCQAMYTKFPEAPYVAMWTMKGDLVYVSLRSSSTGADVSQVAKVYGGGGHSKSSGFTTQVGQWFKPS
jgi:oligoribonuclease NrnB/cAMP/cGMP phosphodiesterase (DHH superfamily)